MDQTLSTEILERLERRLRAVGAPAIQGARPGLPVDEIRRLTAAIPRMLPAEAELWWTWRRWGEGGDMLPDARYAPLDDCMWHYEWQRNWAREHGVSQQNPDVTPDDWWHPLWLPVFVVDGGMLVVIDISASDGRSAPIRRIDGQSFGNEHFDPIVAPSLGRYITDVLDAIDAGDYVYEPERHVWTHAPSTS